MANFIQQEIQGVICFDSVPPVEFFDFDHKPEHRSDSQDSSSKHIQEGYPYVILEYPGVWPHSAHGRLFMVCNGEQFQGSGIIIGHRFVLTAAHNVYCKKYLKEFDKGTMGFIPAISTSECPYGWIKVVDWYYTQEFKKDFKEDYAVLILDRDIGEYTGMFGLKVHDIHSLNNQVCQIYVYPEHRRCEPARYDLMNMRCTISIDDSEDTLKYNFYGSNHQDGSAIWYNDGDKYYIVGLHTSSSNTNGSGIYLDEHRIKNIVKWMKPYHKEIFNKTRHEDKFSFPLKAIHRRTILFVSDIYLNELFRYGGLQNFRNSPAFIDLVRNFSIEFGITLTSLSLYNNQIAAEEAVALFQGNLINLTFLKLYNNHIRDHGAAALSQGNLYNLTSLSLERNFIRNNGAVALAQGNLSNLTYLNLHNNQIGVVGAEGLSQGNLSNLTYLNLAENNIGDDGTVALSQGNLINLAYLSLAGNNIGDDGAVALSQGNLINLVYLSLELNNIGDDGAIYLSRGYFINLIELIVSNNNIQESGAKALKVKLCNNTRIYL